MCAHREGRLHEQYRERVTDYEARINKNEGYRQKVELDHSRVIREKDGSMDVLKNQNLGLTQAVQQGTEEAKWLHTQVRELQTKVASLNAKRQTESELTENVLKAQLKQVQDMFQQRSVQADQLAS